MPEPQFISILVDTGSNQVLVKLDQAFNPGRMRTELLHLFRRLAKDAEKLVRKRTFGEAGLIRRSGELGRAIQGDARTVSGVPQFRVGIFRGPALKYAGIQEMGTNDLNETSPYPPIIPRKRGALAWPAPGGPAVTAGGTKRYASPRQFEINTGDMLDFVPYRKGGKAIGGLYRQKDLKRAKKQGLSLREIRAVYILLTSASIPPHYYLRDSMKQFLPTVGDALVAWVRKRWS